MLGSAAAVLRGGKPVESRRINKRSEQEKKNKKSREEKSEKRIAEGAEGEGGKTNPGDSGAILNLSGSSNLLRQRKKSRNLALSRLRLLSFYEDIIVGIEYRQRGFSFMQASLLNYYTLIRNLHYSTLSKLLSLYYPAPRIFTPPYFNH